MFKRLGNRMDQINLARTAYAVACDSPLQVFQPGELFMKKCSVASCDRQSLSLGFCCPHYQRFKKHGDARAHIPVGDKTGDRNPKWRGGAMRMSDGRFLIYSPEHPYPNVKNYVLRYRLVVEQSIGRYLLPHEIVHHKNDDPTDDRLENLEVLTRREHIELHRPEMQRLSSSANLARKNCL